MMPIPQLSIITVVRNDQKGLSLTRDSILSQDFQDWQWIVIDGASSDNTLSALENIKNPKITVVSEKDSGLYDAMNKGISIACGAFVNMLNAGDIYADETVLSDISELMSSFRFDILFASQIKKYPNGESVYFPSHETKEWIEYSLPASHQACFIRTSTHIHFPYRLEYRVAADYRCIAEMVHAGAACESTERATIISDKSINSTTFQNPWHHLYECATTQREVFGLPIWKVLGHSCYRLLPIIYWRLSSYIPGASHLLKILGKGRKL